MTTKELRLMIIENFIDYYTSNDEERATIKDTAKTYVEQDPTDELYEMLTHAK